ncbi:MAG: flagellar basal body L-ring protein FlgH [Myxococcales bacterium]|nr:flagellar basal body L-ring protein FlgH [Myxococcales bacterium]
MSCSAWLAAAGVALCAAAGAGCEPPHIGAFTPRQRLYEPGTYARTDPANQPARGSLYSDGIGGFLEDTRAVRVGDVVVVELDEDADAQGTATTALTRSDSKKLGIEALFGLVPALQKAIPDLEPAQMLSMFSDADFKGAGDTARRGKLRGHIGVRVAQELPNGDLFVEGTKVLLINNEEYHLYVSGLVRPADITADNRVSSSRLADAEIEFTGRGDVADQQRKGWLSRALDVIAPL